MALFVVGGCVLLLLLAQAGEWGMLGSVFGGGPARPFAYLQPLGGLGRTGRALFTLSRSKKWLLVRVKATLVPKGELIDAKMALKDMAIAAGLPISPALHLIENSP